MSIREQRADVPFHEAANIFPLLDGDEFDRLVDDIRKYGLREEIALLNGKVIDGRNRYRACLLAGVKRRYTEVETDDPVAYVLSLNLHRRHLTPSQASMVAARAKGIYENEAKRRMLAGKKSDPGANLPQGKVRDQAAKAVGVSGRSVDYASRVLEKGTPELVKAVDDGRVAVSTAAILATEPPEVQDAEATKPNRNRKYKSGLGGGAPETVEVTPEPEPGNMRGVGVFRANEAIDALKRIPRNDPLRKRGFQIVSDWIRANK